MADIPKVSEDQFNAVLRALLKAPPMPMSHIPRKRAPKMPVKRKAKKGS